MKGLDEMNNIISEYQKWKQQGEDLRVQAMQAMESRFQELLVEAIWIAEEYRSDFGAPLKPPPGVTCATASLKTIAKTNPKIAGLQKRLAAAQQKLEQANASGAPTKNLEECGPIQARLTCCGVGALWRDIGHVAAPAL
jgi:hypothetical protein